MTNTPVSPRLLFQDATAFTMNLFAHHFSNRVLRAG